MFSHEKLQVYQPATEWLAVSARLIKKIPKGNADLINQLKRASLSILLKELERPAKPIKERFYSIARGLTMECAAILDAMVILELGDPKVIQDGKRLLQEVAAMLSALTIR